MTAGGIIVNNKKDLLIVMMGEGARRDINARVPKTSTTTTLGKLGQANYLGQ